MRGLSRLERGSSGEHGKEIEVETVVEQTTDASPGGCDKPAEWRPC